jgi:hypothetical protein
MGIESLRGKAETVSTARKYGVYSLNDDLSGDSVYGEESQLEGALATTSPA